LINKLIAADRIADAELAQLIAASALLPGRQSRVLSHVHSSAKPGF
jgi:hypothetical protein